MAEIKIQAERRAEFGKGAARRIRRADKVPAVLYGHGGDPLHLTLPGHDLMLALKNSNALLSIELDGDSTLAIPKQVQRDVIKGFIEHADLLIVKRGEKVTVNIPIHFVGEPVPGALVQTELNAITVEAEATNIPTGVEVFVTGLEIGSQIHTGGIALPEGTTLAGDSDLLVVHITAAPTAEQVEAELAGAEAEVGIEHEVPEIDDDAAEDAAEKSADSE